jgi:hypothetical protein
VFNERLHAFALYWGFRPRACAPYRARTCNDETGVGYVKKKRPPAAHPWHHREPPERRLANERRQRLR